MIKVKITDGKGGIEFGSLAKCFGGLLQCNDMLSQYSIQLVSDNSYDYEFIDMKCFMDYNKSLEDSVEAGVKFLEKRPGDYYLFDGGDSTSLLGSIEVLRNSGASGLFKKQLLDRKDYRAPSVFNKWFFGQGENLNVGYDISEEEWKKINLCGYNLGHSNPNFIDKLYNGSNDKVDVCAIFQGVHPNPNNSQNMVNNSNLYTKHRSGCWEELKKISGKYNIVCDQLGYQEYMNYALQSKVGISPFGMGELCYRDFELVQAGCLLIKPEMRSLTTEPNWLIPNETYVPVKHDWSDLNEVLEKVLENYNDYKFIVDNARQKLLELHTYENVCMHWYTFFNNMAGIDSE